MDPVEVRRTQPDPDVRRAVHHRRRAPPTTAATTSAASTPRSRPPTTTRCAPSRPSRRADGDPVRLGIGVSGLRRGHRRGRPPAARWPGSRCNADGRATVYTGTSPHGQGHQTAWSMIAGERARHPDGRRSPSSTATPTSCPSAVARWARGRCSTAARRCSTRAARWSTTASSTPPTCSRPPPTTSCSTSIDGRFHVAGTPGEASDVGRGGRRRRVRPASRSTSTTTWSPHRHVPVRRARRRRRGRHRDRPGRLLRHRRLRRRRHGSSTRCSSRVRCTAASPRASPRRCARRCVYDDDGNPLTANLRRLHVHLRRRAPELRAASRTETPTPVNPLGAKGIGESGTIGSTPAVQSAPSSTRSSHLGVRHVDMPATPRDGVAGDRGCTAISHR